jgi:hypothetical protein
MSGCPETASFLTERVVTAPLARPITVDIEQFEAGHRLRR